jgi:hypothetical protein
VQDEDTSRQPTAKAIFDNRTPGKLEEANASHRSSHELLDELDAALAVEY